MILLKKKKKKKIKEGRKKEKKRKEKKRKAARLPWLALSLLVVIRPFVSNYHMIICFHDFSKILLALKSLPVSRNCLILRKVVSQDWNRKKEKILIDQSQALKLKLWFKNSQQTKVQDLMASRANSVKYLEKK